MGIHKTYYYEKISIFLGGVVALTACSEDVYQEAEMQNEESGSQYQTNSFDNSNPGGLGSGGFSNFATNYFSPWDIWYNRGAAHHDLQPSYAFSNGGAVGENYSPYTLRVFAWIGLAYFDGNNDGTFNDFNSGNSFVLNTGNYPNLYQPNQEVGNLVRTTIPLPFQPLQGARIEDLRDHLPMPGGTAPRYTSMFGFWAPGFDFAGTLQPQEELLLRDYGKVFFYEVEVFEAGVFIGTYILHPEIKTLPAGKAKNWHPVMNTPGGTTQLQGNLPFGSFKLHYYTDGSLNPTTYSNIGSGSGKCNSFELVFDTAGIIKHQHTLTGSIPKTLTMDFLQHTPTFWQRSALILMVN